MNEKDNSEQNPDELPEESLEGVNGGAIDSFLYFPDPPPPPPKP